MSAPKSGGIFGETLGDQTRLTHSLVMSSEIKQTQVAIKGYAEALRFVEEARQSHLAGNPEAHAEFDEANFEFMEARTAVASAFESLTAVLHRRPETEIPEDIINFAHKQGTEEAIELLDTLKLAKEIREERTAQIEVTKD